jgi:tetratricopeptide (TPR) repeat protein
LSKGEYDKAVADYTESVRLEPNAVSAYSYRGLARLNQKEYDKALADFAEATRIDPKSGPPRYYRAATRLLQRKPEAAADFQAALDAQGWRGEISASCVILGHLAARQAGDEARAKQFLDDSDGKLNANAWPFPAVRFLRGELDEAKLLTLAPDPARRTAACCYLGLDHALKGRQNEALADLRWVKEHGLRWVAEYAVAIAELERLEQAAGGPKP